MRRVAFTAAGTSAVTLLSQGLADHLFSGMPGVKHIAAAIPGAGAAAVRTYRSAGITADACCPIASG